MPCMATRPMSRMTTLTGSYGIVGVAAVTSGSMMKRCVMRFTTSALDRSSSSALSSPSSSAYDSSSPSPTTTAITASDRSTSAPFTPRTHFSVPDSLPRSYFLGHHRAGLDKMKTLASQIDLVIECRDYRIPITGRNPEFERVLGLGLAGGKSRIVVYTKYDLGVGGNAGPAVRRAVRGRDELLARFHAPEPVHFSETLEEKRAGGGGGPRGDIVGGPTVAGARRKDNTIKALLGQLREYARDNFSLTGHRVLVAGMPNVGKSTLLNALRKHGVPAQNRSNKKVAKTGADPGVTRSVGSAVKILEREDVEGAQSRGGRAGLPKPASPSTSAGPTGAAQGRAREATGEGVYLLDTPGVFMPYVPDATSMLKLALCGAVKDTILPPVTVADYLLFSINRHNAAHVYGEFCAPTNDVATLLDAVARRTGRLGRKAEPDVEAAALWFVKRWRQGRLGKFQLDDVDGAALEQSLEGKAVSWTQAVKRERDKQRERRQERLKA